MESFRRPELAVAAAAVTFGAAALGGCAGDNIQANNRPLGACGIRDYQEQDNRFVVRDPQALVSQASGDVRALQQRALRHGGSINLPLYPETKEISANRQSLTLSFLRRQSLDYTDAVTFPIADGHPVVSIGSVACKVSGKLYSNGTSYALHRYVAETTP
jgi:hypothetical protein